MVQIFIEAKRIETPEGQFLQTLIRHYIPNAESFEIIPIDGWTNIFRDTIMMKAVSNSDNGGINLIVFDADYPQKENGGYENRLNKIKSGLVENGIDANVFLWPDNASNGDFETLLEEIARKDLYPEYFDCFGDYEKCVSGPKNVDGSYKYHSPNQKARIFTYISSMQLGKKQRDKLGSGHWMFENEQYWHINSEKLNPIVKFLRRYLQ